MSEKKTKQSRHKISNDLLDELLKHYKTPEDFSGPDGILQQLTGALINRVMEAELTQTLGYEKHGDRPSSSDNYRNGSTKKVLKTTHGEIEINVPRDRNGDHEPVMIEKHQTRFTGFDKQILSMYARGMTDQDIADHIEELYSTKVSKDFVSNVTHEVLEEVDSWRHRPLSSIYPIIYMDGLHIKVRDNGRIINKAVHIVLGITLEGKKEVLGMWIAENEGAKFWLHVLTELKNRGVQDIFIACIDGLTGFPEAIESAFPKTEIQLCIVHLIRNAVRYVSHKDMKEVCADMKPIYNAVSEEEALCKLSDFSNKWGTKYASVVALWQRHWDRLTPFLKYPQAIRRIVYTTNAIEGYNRQLRKVTKNRGVMPNDKAVYKLLYLVTRTISKKWTMPVHEWKEALNQFAIHFADRMPERIEEACI